jgi:tRNA U54 and U55 pseudouridine synthase Pus10
MCTFTPEILKILEDKVNEKGDVMIHNLHIAGKFFFFIVFFLFYIFFCYYLFFFCIFLREEFQLLKEGENKKRKKYSAYVWVDKPVTK